MERTRELLEAIARLNDDPRFTRLLAALKADRARCVKSLIHAEAVSEYGRGVLAGQVKQADELLDLAEKAEKELEAFGTQ